MKGTTFRYHTSDGKRCSHDDGCDGSRWMYSVRIQGRNHTKRGFDTMKAADQALAQLLASIATDTYVQPTAETLAGWAEQWLASIARDVEPSTLANYRWYIGKYILPTLGHRKLTDLQPEHFEALYSAMEGKVGRTTVRTCHGIARNMLNAAVARKKLRSNPVLPAKAGKATKFEPTVWSAADVKVFLDGVKGHRLEALWTLLATTGCRRGEALGLVWDGVDFERGRVRFKGSVVLAVGKPHRKATTKTDKPRWMDIDSETLEALRDWQLRQVSEFATLEATPKGDTLVFTDERCDMLHPSWVGEEFRRLVAGLPLSRIRLHDLRHSHATALLRAKVPVHVVSQRLGHANPTVPMNIYAHVLEVDQADAAATFRRLLQPEITSEVLQSSPEWAKK